MEHLTKLGLNITGMMYVMNDFRAVFEEILKETNSIKYLKIIPLIKSIKIFMFPIKTSFASLF